MPSSGKNFQFDTLYESNLGGVAHKYGPIYLYQIGEISCCTGYTVPLHKQWCHEISYVVSGEGVFTSDDHTNLLVEGDIHFCPRDSYHSIRASGNADLRYGYIGFGFDDDVSGDAEFQKLKNYYNGLKRYNAVDKHNVRQAFFHCLDELYGKGDFSATMVNSYLIQMLVSICRSFEEQPYIEYFPNIEATGSQRSVYLATQYIVQHIFDDISVGKIADSLGYNLSYLSNAFKKSTGMTISQYISKMKIQKSIELMQNGIFNISQVAERLNFATLQSFNKAFKRNTGSSPTEFIKENLNG